MITEDRKTERGEKATRNLKWPAQRVGKQPRAASKVQRLPDLMAKNTIWRRTTNIPMGHPNLREGEEEEVKSGHNPSY